eukprot:g5329.t1
MNAKAVATKREANEGGTKTKIVDPKPQEILLDEEDGDEYSEDEFEPENTIKCTSQDRKRGEDEEGEKKEDENIFARTTDTVTSATTTRHEYDDDFELDGTQRTRPPSSLDKTSGTITSESHEYDDDDFEADATQRVSAKNINVEVSNDVSKKSDVPETTGFASSAPSSASRVSESKSDADDDEKKTNNVMPLRTSLESLEGKQSHDRDRPPLVRYNRKKQEKDAATKRAREIMHRQRRATLAENKRYLAMQRAAADAKLELVKSNEVMQLERIKSLRDDKQRRRKTRLQIERKYSIAARERKMSLIKLAKVREETRQEIEAKQRKMNIQAKKERETRRLLRIKQEEKKRTLQLREWKAHFERAAKHAEIKANARAMKRGAERALAKQKLHSNRARSRQETGQKEKEYSSIMNALKFRCSLRMLGSLLDKQKTLSKGWTVDSFDRNVQSRCLHIACRHGHFNNVSFLLRRGASVNLCDCEFRRSTPLHEAASAGWHTIVSLLLEKGASGYLQDVHGDTALHAACRSGHIAAAKILFQHTSSKMSIRTKNFSNHEPIDLIPTNLVSMRDQMRALADDPSKTGFWLPSATERRSCVGHLAKVRESAKTRAKKIQSMHRRRRMIRRAQEARERAKFTVGIK